MSKFWAAVTVVAVLCGVAAVPAYAAKKEKAGGKADKLIAEFKKLDKNNDGKLSREEFTSGVQTVGKGKKERTPEQQFKALDKDNDGSLTPTEFAARGEKKK